MSEADTSVTCEMIYSLILHITLPNDLINTKFIIQYSTDYAKGQTIAKSDIKGILTTRNMKFQSIAHGTWSSLDSPCTVNILKGRVGGKLLGSYNFNLSEKIKMCRDINLCPMGHSAVKFFYLQTEKLIYKNAILAKTEIICNLLRCRLGNEYYKVNLGLWILSTDQQEVFDLGIDFINKDKDKEKTVDTPTNKNNLKNSRTNINSIIQEEDSSGPQKRTVIDQENDLAEFLVNRDSNSQGTIKIEKDKLYSVDTIYGKHINSIQLVIQDLEAKSQALEKKKEKKAKTGVFLSDQKKKKFFKNN